ncbi:uncharacterized protein PRCAT00000964001 [Priceomyces carsonii]|uniref:uncharacterized protein n=1 Tax=Priceomyces carsonii TaxID=28549 RepID=UPI002ED922E6|nr:unnamed protein product [Priceomyces carsonii]
MQFLNIALLAAAAVVVKAETTTETDFSTEVATITSCGPEVTNCPAESSVSSAPANVSSWEGAAVGKAQYGVAGAAALAAGALLAL